VCDGRRGEHSEQRANHQIWRNFRSWRKIFKYGRNCDLGGICGTIFKNLYKMAEIGGKSSESPKNCDFGGKSQKIVISAEKRNFG
jgi:hypothetical protein